MIYSLFFLLSTLLPSFDFAIGENTRHRDLVAYEWTILLGPTESGEWVLFKRHALVAVLNTRQYQACFTARAPFNDWPKKVQGGRYFYLGTR